MTAMERIQLTHTTKHDYSGILAYMQDDTESGDAWFTRPQTLPELSDYMVKAYRAGSIMYTATLKGKVVGMVSFSVFDSETHQVGFFIAKSARSKGLHLAIAEVATRFKCLVAWPYADNMACIKFLTKLGFKDTGIKTGQMLKFIKTS